MIDWLAKNWALLALALTGAAYFAFYVSAARGRRSEPAGPRRPEKDC
jgi:hypothetical protein